MTLVIPAPWIGSRPRLGKALAAIQLAEDPLDWVVKDLKLDTADGSETPPKLVSLERHHVFPRKILEGVIRQENRAAEDQPRSQRRVPLHSPRIECFPRRTQSEYLKWILVPTARP